MVVKKLQNLEDPRHRVGTIKMRNIELYSGGGGGSQTDRGRGFKSGET